MKFVTNIFIIAVVAFIAELFLPWWSVAIAAGVLGVIFKMSRATAFSSGFTAISLLWLGYAYFIDYQTLSILTPKVVELLQLPNPGVLYAITAFIGGLVGGMGALTGNLLRQIFVSPPIDRTYDWN